MYVIDVSVIGDAPLMQHQFPVPEFGDLSKGGTRQAGSVDYTEEWRKYLYVDSDGEIYQPAAHFEGAMVKAATNFKITGKRGRTYKDLLRAAVFIKPEEILYGIRYSPEMQLDTDGDKPLYLDLRQVVVNRGRITRIRPTFKPGWKLDFQIEVLDDQIPRQIIQEVLAVAGKTVGIGDFRPKFGRFSVARFEVV